jgi:hypothetical protein
VRQVRMPLLTAATVLATLALGAGHASAGGPTSVIIVNPANGAAGALYFTDSDYELLIAALEPYGASVEHPPGPASGPGTAAINVSWLVHNVRIWRIDDIRLNGEHVWVQTMIRGEPEVPGYGDWHLASNADAVVEVLERMGVIGEGTATETPGVDAADSDLAGSEDDTLLAGWWWALPGAVAGVALGSLRRPALVWLSRRRDSAPHIELIDA